MLILTSQHHFKEARPMFWVREIFFTDMLSSLSCSGVSLDIRTPSLIQLSTSSQPPTCHQRASHSALIRGKRQSQGHHQKSPRRPSPAGRCSVQLQTPNRGIPVRRQPHPAQPVRLGEARMAGSQACSVSPAAPRRGGGGRRDCEAVWPVGGSRVTPTGWRAGEEDDEV